MSGLEALQAVQFISVKDRHYAVIEAEEWEGLIEWLEALEDTAVFEQAMADLAASGGSPQRAGWLRWEDVRSPLALDLRSK